MSIVARPRLLKMREDATLLNVSPSTVWEWYKDGRIKSVRLPAKPDARGLSR